MSTVQERLRKLEKAPAQEEVLTAETLGGFQVQPVQDVPPHINLLVYGDPGAGKTVLAGSASAVEEMSPVLLIDVEGGSLSLRHTYPRVDTIRLTSFNQFGPIYEDLQRGQHGYRTVVLDSLSEMQKLSMWTIMRELVEDHPDRDVDIASLREWGKNTEQIRRLVRLFKNLPLNVVFTCLAAADKDAKTGIVKSRPGLSGKLASEVAGFVDIVCYLYTKQVDGEIRRLLLTANTDTQVAKDRTGKLPEVVESPDMKTIYTQIQL